MEFGKGVLCEFREKEKDPLDDVRLQLFQLLFSFHRREVVGGFVPFE